MRHFEMDLGPVFLMGLIARAPGESFYNITFTKTFPETGQRGGFTIHTPHMLRMTREWERRGERCPVVNVLGHHPGFWLGTLNNTPWGDNECATAGGFLQESVRLVPSVTWGKDFLVPFPGFHDCVSPVSTLLLISRQKLHRRGHEGRQGREGTTITTEPQGREDNAKGGT